MDSVPTLKSERRELQAKLKKLRTLPGSPDVAQERATTSELIRECDSKLLIQKATRWGIEVPSKPDWYSVQNKSLTVNVILPYLNDTATAILSHQIRKAKLAYWQALAGIIITILSLVVATLALLKDVIVGVLGGVS